MFFCKGKYGIILPAIFNFIQHMSGGYHRSPVYMDTHIGVDTRISTERTSLCCNYASVDNQPSIGINSVALTGFAVHFNVKLSTVYRRNRNAVFVSVDSIIARVDIDDAAVYR